MNANDVPTINLTDALDIAVLQELQDSLATLSQVAMQIIDFQGRPVTRPSRSGPLCRLLLGTAVDSEPGQTPIAPQPARTVCHTGAGLFSVPITLDGQRLGGIEVGDRPVTPVTPSQLAELAGRWSVPAADLADALDRIGPWTNEQRKATIRSARLLAETISLMVRQDRMIRERVEELTAVYNVAGLLAGTDDLTAILNTAATTVTDVLRVKACSIRLLDQLTGELIMTAVQNLSDDYVNKGPITRRENSVDAAVLAGQTVYIADSATDPRIQYQQEAKEEGIVSQLCAPLSHRGQHVGVIRVYTDRPHRFSLFETSLLKAVGSQAAAAIVNARLFAQRQQTQRYQSQLAYAGEIQRRMVPTPPSAHGPVTFGTVYTPTLDVGGDFYDFLSLPEGNLGLAIADVVGKGIPAALLMASVRSALRGHAHSIYEIDEIMIQVNRHLCRDTLTQEFATLFYGVFTPNASHFTYCSAGHEPPLLLRGQTFKRLETGGTVIGIDPNAAFDQEAIALHPGDILVFVTDGVTEALNFEGEQFGRQRLRNAITRYRDEDARTLARQILWDVRRFAGLAPQADDLTVVAAKVSVASQAAL